MTKTCTVRGSVVEGGKVCDKPAVRTWTSRVTGESYGECVEHDLGEGTQIVPNRVGDFVTVVHGGISKRGQIVAMNGSSYKVKVPIHGGKDEKVITRTKAQVD